MKNFKNIFNIFYSFIPMQFVKTYYFETRNHHFKPTLKRTVKYPKQNIIIQIPPKIDLNENEDNTNKKIIEKLNFDQNLQQQKAETVFFFNVSNEFVKKKLQKYLNKNENSLDFEVQKTIINSFIRKSKQNLDNLKEKLSNEDFQNYESTLNKKLSKFSKKFYLENLTFTEILESQDILFNLQEKYANKSDDEKGSVNLDKQFSDLKDQDEERNMSKMDKEFSDLKDQEKERKKN